MVIKKLVAGVVVMIAISLFALDSVEVTSVTTHQRYPWNGLVDVDVMFDGEVSDLSQVECTFAATNSATKAALRITYIARAGNDVGSGRAWKRRYVWNAAADLGEVEITNIVLTVSAKALGAVQLWENGPYWAECNVGASTPEEYGYYFLWCDTVGYKREGGTWTDDWFYSGVTWVSSTGMRMSSSPFSPATCPTNDKSTSQLQSAGYIDSTGNLVAAHDAATVHLGAPWRMPTDAEMSALISNCTTTWITTNGVNGRLITGKGMYASKSIFLPAAGFGYYSNLGNAVSCGYYWSSSPYSGDSSHAWGQCFNLSDFGRYGRIRCFGQSVRPIRGFFGGMVSILGSAMTCLKVDCVAGPRASLGDETLRYSTLWDGGSNETAKVTLKQGDEVLFENLATEGEYDWSAPKNGTYALTHTTYTNGAMAKVLNATFVVTGKYVPFPPG